MTQYSNYKDSGVEWNGEIPEHWKEVRVKYLLRNDDGIKIGPFGSALKLDTLSDSGIKIYGQGNVIKDDFTIGTRYLPIDRFNEDFSQYEIVEGDVLVTMMGTTGKSKVFSDQYERGIIDSHLLRLRFNNSLLSSYLFTILLEKSDYIYHQVKINSKGSIMEGLNSSIVKELAVFIPPLSEQQAIVTYLDEKTTLIDDLIKKKQEKIQLLKENRTALINHVVTKGLDPEVEMKDSGVEWIGEIPKEWQVKRLKYLGQVKYGLGQPPKLKDGGLPLIRATNVYRGIIDEKNMVFVDPEDVPYERDPVLRTNDIIVVRSGAYTADSAIIPEKFDGAITGYDMVFRSFENYNSKFISYGLLSDYILKRQLLMQSLRAAQPHLNREELNETIVVCPHFEEQQQIVTYLIDR